MESRRLWYTSPNQTNNRVFFDPITIAALGLGAIGLGSSLFGKKKSQDVPDPLAGLRAQLQGLAGQIPGQVAKQKEITAQRVAEAKTTGAQGIAENIRAERGFGNTSLQDRLNTELADKLFKSQQEADLAAENWGIGQQASILQGTASMYPGAAPEEAPSWQSQLLGAGTNLAVQNWMDENKWKNISKYFGKDSTPTPTTDWSFLDKTPDWKSYTKFR